ncbi:MAG: 4'-phosphopantetheinyl transferase family protein [Wenzhouxiangella sp.]
MSAWQDLRLPVRPRPLPPPDRVECWLINLNELALPGANAAETDRRGHLRLHRQFVLRLILGAYLACPGKDVALTRGPSGKPELVPELAVAGLRFNLSHTSDWLALAVTREVPVGVDIEHERRVQRALEMARRYFSPAEADCLASLEEPQRSQAFFKLWTVREACIKAMGSSLAQSLSALALDAVEARLLQVPVGWPDTQRWSVLRPELAVPLHLCIAVPRPGMRWCGLRLHCRPG